MDELRVKLIGSLYVNGFYEWDCLLDNVPKIIKYYGSKENFVGFKIIFNQGGSPFAVSQREKEIK